MDEIMRATESRITKQNPSVNENCVIGLKVLGKTGKWTMSFIILSMYLLL